MTRFELASPRQRLLLCALALGVGLLLLLAAMLLLALGGLRQLGPATDWRAVPDFLVYYRHDPHLHRWLARGLLTGLLVDAILLALWLRPARALHGAARFAREREIRKAGLRAPHGILLGRRGGRFLIFGGPEHILVEAPTRSGKGVGIVIPNLLNWRDSVVVLDIKRENWAATAGFRRAAGQEVHLFDPLDPDGRTARYNPLGHIDRDDGVAVIDELQKIAVMLFPTPDRGDPFWVDAARVGFIGVGAYLAGTPGLPFTIGAIYHRLTAGNPKVFFQRELHARAEAGRPLSAPCTTALADFTAASDNTFASIKQTITSRLNLWLNPHVDAATASSDFDLRDLLDRRVSIYLGVTPDNIDRVAPLYNLFFQQLVDLNTRTAGPRQRDPIELLVLLDEFARLGRADVLASGFSYVAGYGIRLMPVIQSRAQLRALYGHDVADEIVANCGLEVAFTPKELKIANELSERLGTFTAKATSRSRHVHGLLANRSLSESEQRRALMLPQELMQLPPEKLLLLRGGVPPVLGDKLVYHADRCFTARLRPAPEVAARVAAVDAYPMPAATRLFDMAELSEDRPIDLALLVRDERLPLPDRPLDEAHAEALLDQYLATLGLDRDPEPGG